MTEYELKEYLQLEWKYNNHNKYQKYFEQWFVNLTPSQIISFEKQLITKINNHGKS